MPRTVNDWLAVRADLGYLWEWVFLLNTTAEIGGLRGKEELDVDWTRVRIHAGAEVMFCGSTHSLRWRWR